jgi:hypothetical protein
MHEFHGVLNFTSSSSPSSAVGWNGHPAASCIGDVTACEDQVVSHEIGLY